MSEPAAPEATVANAEAVAETEAEVALEAEQRVAEATPADTTQQASEDTTIMAVPEEPTPEDDPVMRTALFATATPLPDIDSLRPFPPFRADASGPLVVQFQLNEAGKITELERITVTTVTETDSADTDTAQIRIKRPKLTMIRR